jgi:hypothetical protein
MCAPLSTVITARSNSPRTPRHIPVKQEHAGCAARHTAPSLGTQAKVGACPRRLPRSQAATTATKVSGAVCQLAALPGRFPKLRRRCRPLALAGLRASSRDPEGAADFFFFMSPALRNSVRRHIAMFPLQPPRTLCPDPTPAAERERALHRSNLMERKGRAR